MKDSLKDKIEAYLEQKLSPEESLLFEEEIARNPELQEKVLLSKEINEHLRGDISEIDIPENEYSKKLQHFFDSEEAENLENKLLKAQKEYRQKKTAFKRRKTYLSIAATIAILIIGTIGYTLFNQSNTHIFDEYYSVNDLPSVIKRDTDESLLTKGALEFKNKNYENALSFFESYEVTIQDNVNVFLYKGAIYIALEKYDEAINEFDKIVSSNSIDNSKGLWFKALVYVKTDNYTEAKSTLKKLLESESNFKFSEAQELLNKIND